MWWLQIYTVAQIALAEAAGFGTQALQAGCTEQQLSLF